MTSFWKQRWLQYVHSVRLIDGINQDPFTKTNCDEGDGELDIEVEAGDWIMISDGEISVTIGDGTGHGGQAEQA